MPDEMAEWRFLAAIHKSFPSLNSAPDLAKAISDLIDEKIAAAFGEFIEPDGHVPVPKSDVFRKLARHPGKQRS